MIVYATTKHQRVVAQATEERAKIRAARLGTSVKAAVQGALRTLTETVGFDLKPGQRFTGSGGAAYRVEPAGNVVRTNKPPGRKKERRRARRVALGALGAGKLSKRERAGRQQEAHRAARGAVTAEDIAALRAADIRYLDGSRPGDSGVARCTD